MFILYSNTKIEYKNEKICLVSLVNSNINHPLENMLYHNLITRSVYKTLMVSLHSKNMTDLAWTKRTEHIFHVGNVCCPLLKAELGGRKKSTASAICQCYIPRHVDLCSSKIYRSDHKSTSETNYFTSQLIEVCKNMVFLWPFRQEKLQLKNVFPLTYELW